MPWYLEGDSFHPEIVAVFDYNDRLPDGTMTRDWVKGLPGRRWDKDERAWIIDSLGPRPALALRRAGIELDLSGFDGDFFTLDDLAKPVVRLDRNKPGYAKVAPRLFGRAATLKLLGAGAWWDEEHQRIQVPVADLADKHGNPRGDLTLPEDLQDAIVQAAIKRKAELAHRSDEKAAAAHSALATDLSTDTSKKALASLTAKFGPLPDWFSVDLFEYQRLGAYAVAGGRHALCDSMGLGKTYQALAALALMGSERALLVVPPVVLSNWASEWAKAGLPGETVVVDPRRKQPPLPAAGAVIVADSTLVARPQLVEDILGWGPDALIVDEAHRARTYTSQRSTMIRELAEQLEPGTPRIVLTGTPMSKSPAEIAAILAITGQLQAVFGGFSQFVEEYCLVDKWGKYKARKRALPKLRRLLDQHVWVRRHKDDVLKDLPPKRWSEILVDVDLRGFRASHSEALDTVRDWLATFRTTRRRDPNPAEIRGYAEGAIGIVSPMRKAAGLAKIDAAAEYGIDWDAEHPREADLYPAPLLLWCHHHEVMDQLSDKLSKALGRKVPILSGETPMQARDRYVTDFQAGKIPIMICQITAAGVGITLTRSSDAVFVETDWNVELIAQAEDRCVLEGQRVVTRDGMVPIEEVRVGDMVLGSSGRFRRVLDVWSRKRTKRTPRDSQVGAQTRIITEIESAGFDTLKVTDDHPVYVSKYVTGDEGWTPAGDVKPLDRVAIPRWVGAGVSELSFPDELRVWTLDEIAASRVCVECGGLVLARNLCTVHYQTWQHAWYKAHPGERLPKMPQRSVNGRHVAMPETVPVDDEFLYLCGWYLAEGCSSVRTGKGSFVSISTREDERFVLERIGAYLEERFGVTSTIYTNPKSRGIELRGYSRELAAWFSHMFGNNSHSKKLPSWVFDLTRDQAAALVAEYQNGDGHLKNGNHQRFVTVSRQLANGVAVLLAGLGHRAYTHLRAPGGKPIWTVEYTVSERTDKELVWRQVNGVSHRTMRRRETVWDITVEHDESFVVEGTLVHNCHRIGATGESVSYTTLIAVDTLDSYIHKVRLAKKELVDAVTGREGQVPVKAGKHADALSPAELVVDLVHEALAEKPKTRSRGGRT